jgi:hypothetical protein
MGSKQGETYTNIIHLQDIANKRMQADKNNSWKEKIDPAFDDLIKVCLDYIKHS